MKFIRIIQDRGHLMERSNKFIEIGYVLSIVFFILGLRIALTWSYTSRLVGIALVCLSLLIAFKCYKKTHIMNGEYYVDKKQALMGLFLILIDVIYNIISLDAFKSFDFGVIIAGFLIILLNIGFFSFLKLDRKIISFSTFFLFIMMILYGFLFSGLPFILGDKDYNLFFEFVTDSVVLIAGYILNIIKPTTINDNLINFHGFKIWIGNPCSGIESISVFFSAVIAYMIASKMKDIKKVLKYLLIGGVILYIVNILRVLTIILTGYYLGIEIMQFVHYHLGWIFFLISMGVFWSFVLKDSDPENLSKN
jgi:archaeosortase C (PEF-CTERM variant)